MIEFRPLADLDFSDGGEHILPGHGPARDFHPRLFRQAALAFSVLGITGDSRCSSRKILSSLRKSGA